MSSADEPEVEPREPHQLAIELADNRYGAGHWAACKHPERPPDDMAVFVVACSACKLMIHVALSVEPPEGSPIYPGWWRNRTQFQRMLARRSVQVIAHKPDLKWRRRVRQ